jgi:hypothetical protein
MFAWLCPFVSRFTLGNDYQVYTPGDQLDLMWTVWKGTFPLFIPGFAGGHSTAAMTLGQFYHPLPWISSIMPGFWHGQALEWNTTFRLLSLGIAHISLFKLCRRLHVTPLPAFVATFPVVYNLRMLDSFRYGASLDSYAATLLVVAAAGFVFLDQGSKKPVAFLALGTYLVVVSGHPQWAFLGLMSAGSFAVLFPWAASALDPACPRPEWRQIRRYVARLAAGFGSGLLFSAPYLLPFYFEFFKTNQSRTNGDYSWSVGYADSIKGEFANFLFPLHADVHGAFGGSALFLLAALFPLAALVKKPPRVLWFFYAIGAVAYFFALGKESWIHPFMVKSLPLFGSFRVPGRIVIWIPVMMLPILVWMFRVEHRSALIAAGTGALVLVASHWIWTTTSLPASESLSPHKILGKAIPTYVDGLIFYVSGATLLCLTWSAKYRRFSRPLLVLAMVGMLVTTWICMMAGTWSGKKPTMTTFDQLTAARKLSVLSHADSGSGMEMRSVSDYQTQKIARDRGLGTIAHSVEQLGPDAEILKRLKQKLPKGTTPTLFLDRPVAPLAPDTVSDHDEVKLVHNTSNLFIFEVKAGKDGYFVFNQPMMKGFQCTIDGAPVEIATANALYPAVFLPRGAHRVEIRFVSKPFFAGVAVGFVTLWVWIFVSVRRRRRLLPFAAVLSAAALTGLVYLAVYKGPSFGTSYTWQAPIDAPKSAG